MAMEGVGLNGNWIDLGIIVFLIFYIISRLSKGFIEGVIDFLGFIFSMWTALTYFSIAAIIFIKYFSLPRGISNALGFFVIAFVAEIILFVVSLIVEAKIPQVIKQSRFNKYLGFLPSIFSGLTLTAFFMIAIIALPVRPNIKQAVLDSKIGGALTQKTLGVDNDINQVFGGAIKEALTFLTVKPESDESINLNFTTTNFSTSFIDEAKMLQLVNDERRQRSVSILVNDSYLQNVARLHCGDMFKRGYFSHYTPEGKSPFDRMEDENIGYKTAGENLAYAPTVEVAHEGLMNSPGHKANILSVDFGKVGIGVIDGGVYGKMFCQEFSD